MTDNYFNYFTEIEEHFQRAQGTGLFLLSPLDWALIESWKNSRNTPRSRAAWDRRGVREVAGATSTRAFSESQFWWLIVRRLWPKRLNRWPQQTRQTQAAASRFSIDDVRAHIQRNADSVRTAGQGDLAESLAERLNLEELFHDLEKQLEQRLTAIEEKMIARARAAASEEALFRARRMLDQELKPYRGKMSAERAQRPRWSGSSWIGRCSKAPVCRS